MRTIRKVGKSLAFYLSDPRNLFATEKVGTSNDGLNYWCLRENYIERSILTTGFWELHETPAVKRTLRPGWIVFDIGANIGYFTLLMSKLVGAGGQVHGFEPTGYAFERLERIFFFSSRRRHTRSLCDWSSDVCSSDLATTPNLSRSGAAIIPILVVAPMIVN